MIAPQQNFLKVFKYITVGALVSVMLEKGFSGQMVLRGFGLHRTGRLLYFRTLQSLQGSRVLCESPREECRLEFLSSFNPRNSLAWKHIQSDPLWKTFLMVHNWVFDGPFAHRLGWSQHCFGRRNTVLWGGDRSDHPFACQSCFTWFMSQTSFFISVVFHPYTDTGERWLASSSFNGCLSRTPSRTEWGNAWVVPSTVIGPWEAFHEFQAAVNSQVYWVLSLHVSSLRSTRELEHTPRLRGSHNTFPWILRSGYCLRGPGCVGTSRNLLDDNFCTSSLSLSRPYSPSLWGSLSYSPVLF